MKPIYIVQSSDCGVIGVFGNIKSAYNFASKRQAEMYPSTRDLAHLLDKSYDRVCNELRGTVNYPVDLDLDGETSITCFELNRTDYTPAYMDDTPYSEGVK